MTEEVITPYGKTKVYENGTGPTVIVVPGFGGSIVHNKVLVHKIAEKGYDAITFDQPRRDAKAHPIDRLEAILSSILSATVADDTLLYGVAHSLGSAALLRVARKHPERFKGLLLMQPAGIGDPQTLMSLMKRVSKKTAKNHSGTFKRKKSSKDPRLQTASFGQIMQANVSNAKLIALNPSLALKEAKIALEHTIKDDIAAVQELGIPVQIIVSHHDDLFSMSELGNYEAVTRMDGSYSSIANKESRHDTFWMHPEQTAALVDGFIRHI